MTHLEMLALLHPHLETSGEFDAHAGCLSQVVDCAQNLRPLGEGDGTIDEETWTAARNLRNALIAYVRSWHALGDRLRFRGALK